MQAIKDKLHDMNESRKVKAELREEENAEKEYAKARVDVAHEIRLAKEAEAAMDLHVNKAANKARKYEEKHKAQGDQIPGDNCQDPYGCSSILPGSSNQMNADSTKAGHAGSNTAALASNTATGITGNPTAARGGPTTN